MFKLFFLFISFFTIFFYTFGQKNVVVKGIFHADSIKIGQLFDYSLTVNYPNDVNLVFPDSTYSYSPFEFDHKEFFPTKTLDNISYDSVIYHLYAFDLDPLQTLKLPVFVIHANDCTAVYTLRDSIQVISSTKTTTTPINQLPLKTNTDYQDVIQKFNYLIVEIIGGSILIAVVGIWFFFGKRIRIYFTIKKMTKKHIRFIRQFEENIRLLKSTYSPTSTESILINWKEYMEYLLGQPFTKHTTKEIAHYIDNSHLQNALQNIDKSIYSNTNDENGVFFLQLHSFCEDCFKEKIIQTKNG